MVISKAFLFAVLVAGAAGLRGCPGKTVRILLRRLIRRGKAITSPRIRFGRPTRAPGNEAQASGGRFLSSYSNPQEGISFRYPRYYALEEGDLEERSFFSETPRGSGHRAAWARDWWPRLLIPEDGYPNTTFEHGSLQLLVNASATARRLRRNFTWR